MKKTYLTLIFPLIFLLLLTLLSCSMDQKTKYVQSFIYWEKDGSGDIQSKRKDIDVGEGESVPFPSAPESIEYTDSFGNLLFTDFFVGWAKSLQSGVYDYSYLNHSSFIYSHIDSSIFYAVYCRKIALDDGTSTLMLQLGDAFVISELCYRNAYWYSEGYEERSIYEFVKTLRSADISPRPNSSIVGWKLDYSSYIYDGESNTFKYYDNIRITNMELVESGFNANNPGAYVDCKFEAYEGNDFVGYIDFFSTPKSTHFAINGDYYYELNSPLVAALSHDPHFTVLWELYPVVSFINGTNTSQSSVAPNTCVQKPADPSENGFKFMWWSLNEAGEAFDFNTPITEDTNLYAVFKQLFTVTFVNEGLTSTVQVAYGEYAGKLNPTKAGHTLQGWSLTQDGPLFDFEETPITSDTTLYAIWEEN